mgnify:CR=1 FL=1
MVRRDSIWKSLDWVTIIIYLMLIVFGWFSICGASYDYGDRDFLDFSTRAGKQFMWIVCSFGLGFILLMLEDTLYDMFSYIIYIGLILLLVVTIFIAPDTKGSRSWLILGPVSLQPAEFAKFATALALAKYMSAYSFTIKSWKSALMLAFLILLPMTLIILQRETGSALVYMAFFLMLYREGMPGVVLFSGICAVVYFVVGIRFDQVFIADTPTPIGEFVVLSMILLFAGGMVWVYKKKWEPVDRANVVLAVWDGTYGGTANCYNYAKKMMKEVIIINPNQLPNILGIKTQLRADKISNMESLANQYPIIKEIDSYPYLQFLESKTIEELLEIKETKNRQAHFNSQEAMRTGDSLRSSTGTRLFKEVHLITRFINLIKEQNESKEG